VPDAALALPSRAGRAALAPARPVAPERAAANLDRLYRFALTLCGSPHLADDLVQDAYARFLARPRLIRGADEFAYLARIVRNLRADHYRRPPPAEPTDEALAHTLAENGGWGDPEAAARTRELLAHVGGLPAAQRETVAAVDVAGMSYRQAARALGVPIGTVMSRLARGRSRLALMLEGT
jgi:RNA polymerase sigma-70 factor (ECF subfamily)